MNNISIVLVAPQMGENIGAAARAMKNFGLSDLRIVNPRDGWPNEKAEKMAVGAVDIIQNAKIYFNLVDAIADLEFIYATTSIARDMNKTHISSKDLSEYYPRDLKVGIMFGRESSGLNNNEIALANAILTINTTEFNSLNIAHAIAIISYELFIKIDQVKISKEKIATREEIEYFFNHLFRELEIRNFFKAPQKKLQMIVKIRNLFSRIDKLSTIELQTLRGIIKALTLPKE